jgi:transposase
MLDALRLPVKLAHPLKVKLIAESTIKTDHIDGHALADLLRTNYLPTSYIPSKETRVLRERLRHRVVLVRLRSSLKNRIEAVLAKLGMSKPPQFSHLYTEGGKEWLRGLGLDQPYQSEIDTYLKLIENLTKFIMGLDKEIKRYLARDKRAEYLLTIPGIGEFTAYLILAEIGDINRFSSPKKLTSYAGLVPSVNQSGKHIYFGRITKQGDVYLRWALVEASHQTVRHDFYFKNRYQRLKAVKGSSKAITAIARELLEIVWWVLKEERPYYNREKREQRRELVGSTGRPGIRHGL